MPNTFSHSHSLHFPYNYPGQSTLGVPCWNFSYTQWQSLSLSFYYCLKLLTNPSSIHFSIHSVIQPFLHSFGHPPISPFIRSSTHFPTILFLPATINPPKFSYLFKKLSRHSTAYGLSSSSSLFRPEMTFSGRQTAIIKLHAFFLSSLFFIFFTPLQEWNTSLSYVQRLHVPGRVGTHSIWRYLNAIKPRAVTNQGLHS